MQKCMDSMAIPMASLGTEMLTNPTVVQMHVKTHGFYGSRLECMENTRETIVQTTLSNSNVSKT